VKWGVVGRLRGGNGKKREIELRIKKDDGRVIEKIRGLCSSSLPGEIKKNGGVQIGSGGRLSEDKISASPPQDSRFFLASSRFLRCN